MEPGLLRQGSITLGNMARPSNLVLSTPMARSSNLVLSTPMAPLKDTPGLTLLSVRLMLGAGGPLGQLLWAPSPRVRDGGNRQRAGA
jgi:hypothetical protein